MDLAGYQSIVVLADDRGEKEDADTRTLRIFLRLSCNNGSARRSAAEDHQNHAGWHLMARILVSSHHIMGFTQA
jgi:hypothetical protein